MKSGKLLIATAIGLCLALPPLASAADGAAIYEDKCTECHGEIGQGRGYAGPAVRRTHMSVDEIVTMLLTGDVHRNKPHHKYMEVSEDEAKAVAEHVKSLK